MNPSVVIKTNFGDIAVELFPQAAPKSVSNFLQYAFDDYYDNVLFHRVVSNFVVQAGLFNSQGVPKTSAQRPPIGLESDNGISNLRGTIAYARTNEFDSATSQFYFNVVDNTALDYRSSQEPGYAVFGQVTSGLQVIDAIASVAVETNNGFPNVAPTP
jgi:peptidyl-prolyl cis-trans isomerase A (cyclophilin A)/peptidyl-prolyl cis-trans isomerase B (cyclophilin B)